MTNDNWSLQLLRRFAYLPIARSTACRFPSQGGRLARARIRQLIHPFALTATGGSKSDTVRIEPVTVHVVDDHTPMRESLGALLGGLEFDVKLFASGEEFMGAFSGLPPGVLLTDLRMSGMSGLDLIMSLGSRQRDFPAVIMTAHGDVDSAVSALRLGARDFIQKPFREAELVTILRRESGALRNSGASDGIRLAARTRLAALSRRELEVVQGLALGKTNKLIAHDLDLSVRTVEMHRSRAMDRLACRNLADLMAIALHGDVHTMANGDPAADLRLS